ncbi:MAG: hypothetical protein R6T99_00415 [Bacteroidales bacterium]
MRTLKTKTSLFSIFFILLLSSGGYGQIKRSSPYSRFGVGELQYMRVNSVSPGMGALSNALNGSTIVNMSNPATYESFDSLSFVFDGAVVTSQRTLKTEVQSQTAFYASLNHLVFGFPVSGRIKSSFGIVPYSDVGYNTVLERDRSDIGRTQTYYEGTGGITRAYAGASVRILKYLSLGANLNYNFGTLNKKRTLYFIDSSATYFNTRLENKVRVSDISVDLGLLFRKPIHENYVLSSGLTFTPATNLSAKREYLATTFVGDPGASDITVDTAVYQESGKGNLSIPLGFGAGVTFEKPGHFLVGADFNWQEWEKYEAFGYSDSLTNGWNVSVGGQFIPDKDALRSYFRKATYRFGARYSKTFVSIKGKDIDEFGISFGVGLPVLRSTSMINLGFEIGGKGTTAENLIRENFVIFTFGIVIDEHWFMRRKYN